jgi:hypothetical protein
MDWILKQVQDDTRGNMKLPKTYEQNNTKQIFTPFGKLVEPLNQVGKGSPTA